MVQLGVVASGWSSPRLLPVYCILTCVFVCEPFFVRIPVAVTMGAEQEPTDAILAINDEWMQHMVTGVKNYEFRKYRVRLLVVMMARERKADVYVI